MGSRALTKYREVGAAIWMYLGVWTREANEVDEIYFERWLRLSEKRRR